MRKIPNINFGHTHAPIYMKICIYTGIFTLQPHTHTQLWKTSDSFRKNSLTKGQSEVWAWIKKTKKRKKKRRKRRSYNTWLLASGN